MVEPDSLMFWFLEFNTRSFGNKELPPGAVSDNDHPKARIVDEFVPEEMTKYYFAAVEQSSYRMKPTLPAAPGY